MAVKKKNASSAMVREINRKQVITCVIQFGPIPRIEICNRTGLSKPTVTRVIEKLMTEGLFVETDTIESNRGRRPVNIDVNASSRYFIGLNLSKNTLGAALVDLKMNIVEKRLRSLKEISSTELLLAAISNVINEILHVSNVDNNKICGVGVGVPGLVDYNTGTVKDFALAGKYLDIPLVEYLENQFKIPVVIDNNCNTRVLGEFNYGFAVNYKDVMFVINSEGVGCGLIVDGHINRRLNSTASGFGHLCVDLHGTSCYCGGQGCLEAYCSTEEIERKAYQLLCAKNKFNKEIILETPTYQEVCQSVEQGDMAYAGILMEAANAMSSGLISMINLFNPEIIILSGNMFDASEFYYNSVVREVSIRLGHGSIIPKIVRRRVKDALYEIGAATMIMQKIL